MIGKSDRNLIARSRTDRSWDPGMGRFTTPLGVASTIAQLGGPERGPS
jgi:hypothetical protein